MLINVLKFFASCSRSDVYSPAPPASPVSVNVLEYESHNSDGLSIGGAFLPNLEPLSNIQAYLTDSAQGGLISIHEKY